ncbi:hypothetical protein D3C78_768910 [compost metagenome]
MRHGLGQGCGNLVQRQHRLLAGQNGIGVLAQTFPVAQHRIHFVAHRRWCGRQAGGRVTFVQVAPALLEIVTRLAEQAKRPRLARCRLGGVLGNALGQHPQLTGVADVLFVVIGLGVEVGEVGEQQDDRQDQHDEQRRDPGAAARAWG